MKLDGSVAIVTGASSGIGAATARALVARGAHVVAAARRADRLEALAHELGPVLAVPTDVTVAAARQRLVDHTLAAYGRVDLLVNSAGQGLHVPVAAIDPEDLRAVFDLNVVAALAMIQAVLPAMQAQAKGAVVNVSSATSLRLFPGLAGYAATKAALNLLGQIARLELADSGVVVSTVYPSATATEFHTHLRAGEMLAAARRIPADPPELAAAAIIFAAESGEAHVLVADPPRPIRPGDGDSWGALLARQTGPSAVR